MLQFSCLIQLGTIKMMILTKEETLPIFQITFLALKDILDKAVSFSKSRNIDETIILQYRLAPDMLPFIRQIQIATDLPINGLSRLAGADPIRKDDNEKCMDQLKERIDDTLKHIELLDFNKITASKDIKINFQLGATNQGTMKGDEYFKYFIIPNFYFHAAMAYAILRHCGVELGKSDFLGGIPINMS
jgi:hypothetical protein